VISHTFDPAARVITIHGCVSYPKPRSPGMTLSLLAVAGVLAYQEPAGRSRASARLTTCDPGVGASRPRPGGLWGGRGRSAARVYQPWVTDGLRLARFSVQAGNNVDQQREPTLQPRQRHRDESIGSRIPPWFSPQTRACREAAAPPVRRVVVCLCEQDSNGPIRFGRSSPRMAW
jgi:hypothetical protein